MMCEHYNAKNTALDRSCSNCYGWVSIDCLGYLDRVRDEKRAKIAELLRG